MISVITDNRESCKIEKMKSVENKLRNKIKSENKNKNRGEME